MAQVYFDLDPQFDHVDYSAWDALRAGPVHP